MKPYKSNQTRRMPDNSAAAVAGNKYMDGGPGSQNILTMMGKNQRDASQKSNLSDNAATGA